MSKTALILGASGRFGGHTERALQAESWTTRRFNRATDDLAKAARGTEVIVYGWNPPYNKWKSQVMDQLLQVITAALTADATILFPGNVYPYGKDSGPGLSETTAHSAQNELGITRTSMENLLHTSGVKTIILRAGDFIDTTDSGNWLDMIITKNMHKTGKISYPGNPDIPHAWAYLPDFARAMAGLVEQRHDLPRFCSVNFSGYTMSGNTLAKHLDARLTRMNWLPIMVLRPFWPMAKHLLEMRYLWNTPHQIFSDRFDQLLPDFKPTPVQEAPANAVSFQINPDQPMIRTGATV